MARLEDVYRALAELSRALAEFSRKMAASAACDREIIACERCDTVVDDGEGNRCHGCGHIVCVHCCEEGGHNNCEGEDRHDMSPTEIICRPAMRSIGDSDE